MRIQMKERYKYFSIFINQFQYQHAVEVRITLLGI